MSQLIWTAVGAGLVLFIEALYWLYWRYSGAGSITRLYQRGSGA